VFEVFISFVEKLELVSLLDDEEEVEVVEEEDDDDEDVRPTDGNVLTGD
jgi:hypothetical protein